MFSPQHTCPELPPSGHPLPSLLRTLIPPIQKLLQVPLILAILPLSPRHPRLPPPTAIQRLQADIVAILLSRCHVQRLPPRVIRLQEIAQALLANVQRLLRRRIRHLDDRSPQIQSVGHVCADTGED